MKIIPKRYILNAFILMSAVWIAGLEKYCFLFIQKFYAYPSAMVASVFLGRPPVMNEAHEVAIPLAYQTIHVTSTCSAFGFFCLLSAVLLINVVKFFPGRKVFAGCLFVLPLAYGITLLVNGFRFVAGYYAYRVGLIIFPDNFQAAIHQGVGIAFFLSTLIIITMIFEKISLHKGSKKLI